MYRSTRLIAEKIDVRLLRYNIHCFPQSKFSTKNHTRACLTYVNPLGEGRIAPVSLLSVCSI